MVNYINHLISRFTSSPTENRGRSATAPSSSATITQPNGIPRTVTVYQAIGEAGEPTETGNSQRTRHMGPVPTPHASALLNGRLIGKTGGLFRKRAFSLPLIAVERRANAIPLNVNGNVKEGHNSYIYLIHSPLKKNCRSLPSIDIPTTQGDRVTTSSIALPDVVLIPQKIDTLNKHELKKKEDEVTMEGKIIEIAKKEGFTNGDEAGLLLMNGVGVVKQRKESLEEERLHAKGGIQRIIPGIQQLMSARKLSVPIKPFFNMENCRKAVDNLTSSCNLSQKQLVQLMLPMIYGSALLSKHGITHSDIKLENNLMKLVPSANDPDQFEVLVVLSDFGEATFSDKSDRRVINGVSSPERWPIPGNDYRQSKKDGKYDTWACAKTLLAALSPEGAKKTEDEIQDAFRALKPRRSDADGIEYIPAVKAQEAKIQEYLDLIEDDRLKGILGKALKTDPNERSTMDEFYKDLSGWFNGQVSSEEDKIIDINDRGKKQHKIPRIKIPREIAETMLQGSARTTANNDLPQEGVVYATTNNDGENNGERGPYIYDDEREAYIYDQPSVRESSEESTIYREVQPEISSRTDEGTTYQEVR